MPQLIRPSGGYRRTQAFGYVCLIYHATCSFCRRFYNRTNDPLGKTMGQMIGAARSARQNIVEGSSRAGTSTETELRLYDVARASLQELAGDYEAYLVEADVLPWSDNSPQYADFHKIELKPFASTNDIRHEFVAHLLGIRRDFAPWLESEDSVIAANSIVLAIDHACRLLSAQIKSISAKLSQEGDFSDRMNQARRESHTTTMSDETAPQCPICNGPMRKVRASRGPNAGNLFWSCMGFPKCNGTRPFRE